MYAVFTFSLHFLGVPGNKSQLLSTQVAPGFLSLCLSFFLQYVSTWSNFCCRNFLVLLEEKVVVYFMHHFFLHKNLFIYVFTAPFPPHSLSLPHVDSAGGIDSNEKSRRERKRDRLHFLQPSQWRKDRISIYSYMHTHSKQKRQKQPPQRKKTRQRERGKAVLNLTNILKEKGREKVSIHLPFHQIQNQERLL